MIDLNNTTLSDDNTRHFVFHNFSSLVCQKFLSISLSHISLSFAPDFFSLTPYNPLARLHIHHPCKQRPSDSSLHTLPKVLDIHVVYTEEHSFNFKVYTNLVNISLYTSNAP